MHIYFSGLGGVGIGPLAEIALDAGYTVSGSDLHENLMTQSLIERGVRVTIGQDGTYLSGVHKQSPIDWFVYTSALPENHPELVLARQLGLRIAKRDELLAYIIAEKNLKLIAIAGTHGKTTTTGMMVWTLLQLGLPVSYSIGTTLSFGPSGRFDPASEYFIYECDEFDKNFLHFQPYLSIITSIDYDHPDTFPTEDDYFASFRQFIEQSSHVIMWHHDAELISAVSSNLQTLKDDDVSPLTLPGFHNRKNASLVLRALELLTISAPSINQVELEQFPGTDRRFERLADNLYTDYGHHPAEIKATLQMAREQASDVALVYQPHQNVRQHEIHDLYTPDVFEDATKIFWLPTYTTRENPTLAILSPPQLARQLSKDKVAVAELNDSLWNTITEQRNNGVLVLLMGAGTIDEWARKHL